MIENKSRRKPAAAGRSSHPTEQNCGDSVVSLVDKVTPWWRLGSGDHSLGQDIAAWAFSLVVHLAALVGLASLTLLLPIPHETQLASMPVELSDESIPQEFHFSPDPQVR